MAIFFEDNFNDVFGGTGVVFKKAPTAGAGTALTAGGATAINLGSTSGPNLYVGSGVPTLSVPKGSLYLRSDGTSTSTRAYIATDAAGTWTAITTAA